MITCHRRTFEARCEQRGVPVPLSCVVRQDGDMWTIDTAHPDYPHAGRGGPGTQLKAILRGMGLAESAGCQCNKHARLMDERGCDWCEQNIATISGWLAEEAARRKLPYLHVLGRRLIRRAIRLARRGIGR